VICRGINIFALDVRLIKAEGKPAFKTGDGCFHPGGKHLERFTTWMESPKW
jgi:hypothetical protein